jgi:hypothetical protein
MLMKTKSERVGAQPNCSSLPVVLGTYSGYLVRPKALAKVDGSKVGARTFWITDEEQVKSASSQSVFSQEEKSC